MTRALLPGDRLAVDTETTGLDPSRGARPFGVSLADLDGGTAWIEFPVDPSTRKVLYDRRPRAYARLRRTLGDPSITKVFFNAKFDVKMLRAAGLPVSGPIEDVFIKVRVCSEHSGNHGLKPLAKRYFDFPDDDEVELRKVVASLRTRAKRVGGYALAEGVAGDYWLPRHATEIMEKSVTLRKSWRERDVEEALERAVEMEGVCERYGIRDAERTIMLDALFDGLLDELDVRGVYDEEMREVWPVTLRMEKRGVRLDRAATISGRDEAIRRGKAAQESIVREVGAGFNPRSPKQREEYFLDRLGLEPLAFTPKGNPKIDKDFFHHYASTVPVCRAMVEHERCEKAVSTYFDAYLEAMDENGTIHPSFDQAGAITLRYSCRDPNFQNIPKRADDGDIMLEVRRPFGPRPGHVWYCGDYAQIEARIFADKAEEPTMLEAFAAGRDVYDELAATVARLSEIEITRRDAKDIFLGKLYGLGRRKLLYKLMSSSRGSVDSDAADAIVDAFDETFPSVVEFQRRTISEVKREGKVRNRFGQVIAVDPDAAYKGVNYLIQSEAARLMKGAMVRCARYLDAIGYGWLVMTIHDELVFEFPVDRRPLRVLRTLKRLMEDNRGAFPRVETKVEFDLVMSTWLVKRPCKWARST